MNAENPIYKPSICLTILPKRIDIMDEFLCELRRTVVTLLTHMPIKSEDQFNDETMSKTPHHY
jgi:hypothetical protein